MNRNDFTGLITGSRIAGEADISGVREMTMLFPWFHSAHLLLLRSLKESSDVKFDTQLHQSAMFVANREVLYNYLYLSSTVEPVKVQEPATPVRTEEPAAVSVNDAETAVLTREPEPIVSVSSEPEVSKPHDIKEVVTRSREELIAEIESRLRDLANESAVTAPAVAEGSDAEVTAGEATIPEEEESFTSEEDIAVLENDNAATAEETPQAQNESESVLELDMAGTGVETILQGDAIESENIEEDLLELEVDETLLKENTEYQFQIQDDFSGPGEDQGQLSQADLIDRFIQTSPRIERMTPGNEPPVKDLSDSSAEPKSEFITETLARIYVSQGYYSKAINIYEKLTLQYPEKSAYFASRIDKIKDLIK